MPLWSAALANMGQLLPFTPVAAQPCGNGNGRKSKLPKSYKPAPLVTPFQKYKKQERASSLSSTVSQNSSSRASGSSLISSSAPSTDENLHLHVPSPVPGSFEPEAVNAPNHVRLRVEFAKMRVRGHCHGARAVHNVFDDLHIRRRLESQRAHDRASLELLPTQAPPVFTSDPLSLARAPLPASTRQASSIVQKWHLMKKEAEAAREEMEIYAQIRGVNPAAMMRWRRYEKQWAVALDAEDSPPLRFRDVPWPVMHMPHDGSHIHAVEVHRFVLCTSELENVPPYAIPRFSAEIERWQPDRVAKEVLPRVIPREREAVAAAAGAVLDILLKARRDLAGLQARWHTV